MPKRYWQQHCWRPMVLLSAHPHEDPQTPRTPLTANVSIPHATCLTWDWVVNKNKLDQISPARRQGRAQFGRPPLAEKRVLGGRCDTVTHSCNGALHKK
eukprot:1176910-Prorocentrum_minimum.AAC.2